MISTNYAYGMDAEKLTISHYESLGYKLVKHRYKTPLGEIDIIMQNRDSVAFIEVKARTNPRHQEYITQKQVKRCCRAAGYFLASNESKLASKLFRFDLVVIINGKIERILENAWSC